MGVVVLEVATVAVVVRRFYSNTNKRPTPWGVGLFGRGSVLKGLFLVAAKGDDADAGEAEECERGTGVRYGRVDELVLMLVLSVIAG